MSVSTSVRTAVQEDVPWLLQQARAFDAAAGFKHGLMPADEEAISLLHALVGAHVVFVAEVNNCPAGFIAGWYGAHPFNQKVRTLTEVLWWVVPEHRGSRAGLMLLERFEQCGRHIADWTILTLEHDSKMREAHLTKRGFRQTERAFLLEV